MTKQEYFALCARHDWFYDYSDDHSVWKRGNDMEKLLNEISKENQELAPVYKAWADYAYSQYMNQKTPIKPKLEDFQ